MTNLIGAGMGFNEIQAYVQEKVPLIKYTPTKLGDPMDRATEFLVIIATLNDFKQRCEADKAKIQTMSTAFFHNAKEASGGKNITEKKLDAEVDPEYANTRETLEQVESMIKWTRTAIDMFNNAHVTYRQLARE